MNYLIFSYHFLVFRFDVSARFSFDFGNILYERRYKRIAVNLIANFLQQGFYLFQLLGGSQQGFACLDGGDIGVHTGTEVLLYF
jgi:hypothetical protein